MEDVEPASPRFAALTAVSTGTRVMRADDGTDGKTFCTDDPILDLPAVRAAIDLAWQRTKTCRQEQEEQFEAMEGSLREGVAVPLEPGGRETYFKVEHSLPTPVLCSEFSAHVPREAMNITGATQATFHTHPDMSTVREANIVSDAQIAAEEPIPHYVIAEDEVYVLNAPTRRRRWPRDKLASPCALAAPDEAGPVLRQSDASGSVGDHDAMDASVVNVPRGGHPIPQPERSFMEAQFGHDFAGVRIHADAWAARAAAAVNARAFTIGRDIVFGVGQYRPEGTVGRQLLAHELTHVVQQQAVPPLPGVQSTATGTRSDTALMREPLPGAPTRTQSEPLPQSGEATPAGVSWVTEDLKRKLAATVLAETDPEQEYDVMWIYLNRVIAAGGEAGLEGSSAYKGKGVRYRQYLYVLGDETYGANALPAQPQFKGFTTIADYCTNNRWFLSHRVERAKRLKFTVDEIFTTPESSAYPGWTGQGSLKDFNNESNDDVYWKRARAYFWLQESGAVREIYVKVLKPEPSARLITVIFHADAIRDYFIANPDKLPADVPRYTP
jgi:hypothetical protein